MKAPEEGLFPREPNPDSFEGKLGLREGSSQPVFLHNAGNEFFFEFWTFEHGQEESAGQDNEPPLKNPQFFVEISRACLRFGCIGLKILIDDAGKVSLTTHFDSKGVAVDERNERFSKEIFEIMGLEPELKALVGTNVTYHKS